jgi:hypothetical protein
LHRGEWSLDSGYGDNALLKVLRKDLRKGLTGPFGSLVAKVFVDESEAQKLVKSFLMEARGNLVRRTFQRHMRSHHERLD